MTSPMPRTQEVRQFSPFGTPTNGGYTASRQRVTSGSAMPNYGTQQQQGGFPAVPQQGQRSAPDMSVYSSNQQYSNLVPMPTRVDMRPSDPRAGSFNPSSPTWNNPQNARARERYYEDVRAYDTWSPEPVAGQPPSNPYGFSPPPGAATMAIVPWVNTVTGERYNAPSGGWNPPSAEWVRAAPQRSPGGQANAQQRSSGTAPSRRPPGTPPGATPQMGPRQASGTTSAPAQALPPRQAAQPGPAAPSNTPAPMLPARPSVPAMSVSRAMPTPSRMAITPEALRSGAMTASFASPEAHARFMGAAAAPAIAPAPVIPPAVIGPQPMLPETFSVSNIAMPDFRQRDAFIGGILGSLLDQQTANFGSPQPIPPQLDFPALWGQAGQMVQDGWRNPFAFG